MAISQLRVFKEIIISPNKAFDEISNNGKKYFPFAFVILLISVISDPIWSYLIEASNFFYYVEEPLAFDFASIFYEIEVGFFLGVFSAAAIYEIGRRLGGQGTFRGVFSCICYSSLPVAIIGGLISISVVVLISHSGNELFLDDSILGFSILTILLVVILIASLVWSLILGIIALRKSHQISLGKTIGVFILVLIITIIISLLIPS